MPGKGGKDEGMDLDFGPEVAEFRDTARAWLAEHLVGEFAAHRGVGGPTDAEAWDVRLAWDRELAAGGWLGIGWPTAYGGRGLGLLEEIVFAYEYARADAPYQATCGALDLLGPMLVAAGSEAQKRRFLPAILAVRELWGQGFSEPGAGSDLASVRTRAERDGDEWVVNGQKVWTTMGHVADWLYVLVRTDPESRRHEGLSMLLVPVDQPGVEVRPIRNLAGQGEFAEVFLTDARTRADLVVGEVGQGWRTAMTTLGIERGATLLPQQLTFEREVATLLAAARARGADLDPALRDRVVRAWMSVRIMRATNLRTVGEILAGRTPGAQSATAKLYASTRHVDMGHLGAEVAGPAGQITGADGALDTRQRVHLLSLAETIYGGTSQVQRTIIGERVLGLPREPRP
jgi:alkylation response protein AidB-like acyl-CoA dehydrogenase